MLAFVALLLTLLAAFAIFSARFKNIPTRNFIFFHFSPLWHKLLALAMLHGFAQGYIVTAPALLILKFVGQEGTLGLVETAGSLLASLCLYALGRASGPKHRIHLFAVGLILFFVGSTMSSVLFDAGGVLIFMFCMLLAKPLLEIGYYPIQFLTTDILTALEGRSEYAYILNHEFELFAGRFLGCGLLLGIALCCSDTAALRYALPIIAALQLLSMPIAHRLLSCALQITLTSAGSSVENCETI